MRRRKISPRKHASKHRRADRRGRAINSPGFIMRGGIRL